MLVKLWAQQIMLGKKTINDVPRKLKEKVQAYLDEHSDEHKE